ncbi:DNA cytosine methyltransferase [Deinococcus yunweiensis]|uniref:DNA cytosine methyltransferase n=1 Tax=Deinococcus yunweiensis TaxID=367282 RepID=UPI00398EC3B6
MRRQSHRTPYAPLFPYLGLIENAVVAEGELVVDNFAGWGGASKGMEAALKRPVDHAINHDPVAVDMHRINHPHSHHSVEDVWEVDPRDVTNGQPVALAWFSPTCTHFSKAKGAALLDRKIRGLAWVAVRWADLVRPRVIIVENVEEFQGWGPLQPDGRPDARQKGRTFRSWVNALRTLGYTVEWRELRACDYGAPTIRKRLFVVARCDGQPIVWPQATHAAPTDPRVRAELLRPYRTAASCIDWSLPCPSIFDRKKPLVRNTLNRVAQGLRRFVLESGQPFIVTCNHGGEGFRGQGLERPFNTITAANEAHGLAQGYFVPRYGEREDQAPRAVSTAHPSPTVVTSGNGNRLAVAHLVQHNGGSLPAPDASYPATRPARTVMAQGGRQDLVTGALVACGGRGAQARPKAFDEPMHTVTSKADMCLTTAHLTAYYSRDGKHDDSREVNAPLGTVPTVDRFGLTAATLMRQFGTSTACDIDAPAPTVMTEGAGKTGVITAGCATSLSDAQRDRAQQVHAFLLEFLGEALLPHSHDGLVVLQIQGAWYVLADIGMRMLTPRELARCQGFPDSYVLERTPDGKPVSKARQVRGIGNSVSPHPAEALTFANLALPLAEAAD